LVYSVKVHFKGGGGGCSPSCGLKRSILLLKILIMSIAFIMLNNHIYQQRHYNITNCTQVL
jgi:hypothetical protein